MALKIRLWQQGCTNKKAARIVVADSRSPRDGKYIEAIGRFDPRGKTPEQKRSICEDRLQYWVSVGAQMSPTVLAIAKDAAPTVVRDLVQRSEAQRVRRAAKRRSA
jgi:small subunit ribosomal protein S16